MSLARHAVAVRVRIAPHGCAGPVGGLDGPAEILMRTISPVNSQPKHPRGWRRRVEDGST